MECTQRLECTQTQDFEFPHEKECPEQIGFLGICGKTYPIKKGPNKIGRDPHTCNIVLNLNSISRQHAVINVLHKNEFMLMDLDSANKTKLVGKSLQPYVPAPLRNGDTVQFGDVFGIFRLLQEEDDLPMTQAIDIPDTPVPTRHVSKLNAATTVPESPDVSDKDDSFIISSQPKNQHFKNTSNHHFIKPGKTISIQPIGSKKIDNVYWNSSKKSLSLNLDDSNSSLNNSRQYVESNKKEIEQNIHEMETQPPCLSKANESTDSIYTANTQMPVNNSIHTAETQAFVPRLSSPIHTAETQAFDPRHSSPSIHTANTQMPCEPSVSIHCLETQLPVDKLPKVCQTEQEEIQFDLYADDKENDISIYNAKTQCFLPQKENSRHSNDRSKLNTSDENILFDEVDNRSFEEPFESQTILTEDVILPSNKYLEEPEPDIPQSQIFIPQSCKRNNRINSDDSSDCEDINILPTQKIPEVKPPDDDETDCEDEIIELTKNKAIKIQLTDSVIEFQDLTTQVITVNDSPSQNKNADFENMLTQVIAPENDKIKETPKTDVDFEDLPTQVIREEQAEQQFSEELVSPFKVPKKTAVRAKKKDTPKTPKIKLMSPPGVQNNEGDNHYQDTQDIFDDLCTQRIPSPETALPIKSLTSSKRVSDESCNKVSCESPNLDKQSTNKFIVDRSPSMLDSEVKTNEFVSNLSSQEVRDIIGFEKDVAKPNRTGSDSSDLERTPRKVRPFKFMDIDLPNSQEIKTSVSQCCKTLVTESSSDSESENNSESQCTPILFHKKKKKPKKDAKIDLLNKFNAEALPSRVITRVRKPTSKLMDSGSRKKAENILKPTFMTEQDDNVDREIISENISRIKIKNEKSKNSKDDSGIDIRIEAEMKTEDIADVVKRDRKKRNEKQPDKTVKEEKEGSSKKTETKHKTYKNTKNNKVLEETLTTDKTIDTNVTQDSTTTSKRRGRTTRNKTDKTEVETEPEKSILKRKYTKKDTKIDSKQEKSPPLENSNKDLTTEAEQSKLKRKYTKKDTTKIEQDTAKSERDTTKTGKDTTKSERDTRTGKDTTKSERDTSKTGKDKKERDITKIEKETTKTVNEKTPSPEKEVRRSRRQKTVAKKADLPIKSILKNNTSSHEHSTVYNLSTESNNDAPMPLKRHADASISEPVCKRTRCNVSLRATPARLAKTQHVLFTAFPYAEVKVKLGDLGAVVVTDVMKCTMILTEQIKRTFKLLCAVGLGKPIVGPSWVQACADNNTIVDPWLYIIKDEVAERRFNFSLEKTLIGKRNFLHGYNLSTTPSVLPDASEMKLIVECSGGTWKSGTTSNKSNWICISTPQDRALWPDLKERGAIIVSTEFILGGVLRQSVDIEGNLLR